eukprot:Opistho-2@10811
MDLPDWWPDNNLVPGYTQVIVGSGPTDIGLHRDNYGASKRAVDTCLTIQSGCKQVLMLPPDANFFGADNKEPFPLSPTPELIARVRDAGGYYFTLSPEVDCCEGVMTTRPVTLFVPRGWWHWVLGRSEWHVAYGVSRFAEPKTKDVKR